MKTSKRKHVTSKQVQIVVVFLLIGILSVFGKLIPFETTTANAAELLQVKKNEGQSLLLADFNTPTSRNLEKLPVSVKNAVLQAASRDLKLSTSRLKIIKAERRTWKNGCLEVADSNQLCTQVLVSGWQVAVRGSGKILVYHTNDSGSVVKLNPNKRDISPNPLSKTDDKQIKSVPIPVSELPGNVIFPQIPGSGFAGITDKTVLLNDGRSTHADIINLGNVKRISRSQLQRFQYLLEKAKFSKFKNRSYLASTGAAEYRTYVLTSSQKTAKYDHSSQSSLHNRLQVIIKAWNQINS
jgi:hypothetical protein